MAKSLVLNPYRDVQWDSVEPARANLHCHTTVVHGTMAANEVVDLYHRSGYKILAISEHQRTIYPWTDFTSWDETWENRDPQALGMIDIAGNELGNHLHHRGAYWVPVPYSLSDRIADSLEFLRDNGGLCVFNHPGRYWSLLQEYKPGEEYSPSWYLRWLEEYESVVGIEIVNAGDRYPDDRILWDILLTELMPHRPVWGFGGDDAHAEFNVSYEYMTFYPNELTHESVKDAMNQGRFTVSTQNKYWLHSTDGRPAFAPVVTRITVNEVAKTITIEGRGYAEIRWYSGIVGEGVRRKSREVGRGETYRYDQLDGNYVRAELIGPRGTTYTQPFGFSGSGRTVVVSSDGLTPPLVPAL